MLVTGISWRETKQESIKQSVDPESNSVRNCSIVVECSSESESGLAYSVTKLRCRELSYVSEDALSKTSLLAQSETTQLRSHAFGTELQTIFPKPAGKQVVRF